jgi:hypothetical protein
LATIRHLLLAPIVASVAVLALFIVNLGATRISPEHYRQVVDQAVRDGTMAHSLRLPFARGLTFNVVGGSDCLILATLIVPRESLLRASISPRMIPPHDQAPPTPGYPSEYFCRQLSHTMNAAAAGLPLELRYHHRYLHGAVTLAGLTLALVPLDVAGRILLAACYVALAGLAIVAGLRMRAADPRERRRALAFVIIAIVLACFYALPLFGPTFAHAPTDIIITLFLLIGLVQPLCRVPERRFILIVSLFATAIAVLELLTGGIIMGLAALVTAIALGDAPDSGMQLRRLIVGVGCFAAAMVTCFAVKLAAVAIVWGPGEVASFFDLLGDRMTGKLALGTQLRLGPILGPWAAWRGLDATIIEHSLTARLLFTMLILTHSAAVLTWGSATLGSAVVLLPVPLLAILTYLALRRVPRGAWLEQPQPYLLAAGLVPFAWYLAFTTHTATHSYFMMRPLALNVALVAIAVLLMPPRRLT